MLRLALVLTLSCAALPALAQVPQGNYNGGAGTNPGAWHGYTQSNGNLTTSHYSNGYGQTQDCVTQSQGNLSQTSCR